MKGRRISATLPPELLAYIEEYRRVHGLESRSAALAEAVRVLRERELEKGYAELGEAQEKGLEIYLYDKFD